MTKRMLLSLLTLLSAASALAADGRIPIYAQTMTTVGDGTYVVTRDITASGTILNVTGQDVTIDLDGHTLRSSAGYAIAILGAHEVTIRNGRVFAGGSAAINYNSQPGPRTTVRLENLFLMTAGTAIAITNATNVAIEHCEIYDSAAGIVIDDTYSAAGSVLVRDNVITRTVGDSIRATNVLSALITGNRVHTASGSGYMIKLSANGGTRVAGVVISRNVLHGETGSNPAIYTEGAGIEPMLVEENAIDIPGTAGIWLVNDGHRVIGNTVRNASNAIWLPGARCLVERNQVVGATVTGIGLGSSTSVYRDNTVSTAGGTAYSGGTNGGGNL